MAKDKDILTKYLDKLPVNVYEGVLKGLMEVTECLKVIEKEKTNREKILGDVQNSVSGLLKHYKVTT